MAKLQMLAQILADAAPGVVAVSGGVDSRFLSAFAWSRKLDYLAVFLDGPHMSAAERSWAVGWLQCNASAFRTISYDPLEIPEVRRTSADRCYHCKRGGFERIVALARELGRPNVMDGSTGSDLGEYRPGVRALREWGVSSPLAAAGLAKEEIRAAAAAMGLQWPDQPSRPCLLTRFNYGMRADAATLRQLGRVEDALFALGLRAFRLRLPEVGRAVLHVVEPEQQLAEKEADAIRGILREGGFANAEMAFVARLSGYYDGKQEKRA